MQVNMHLDWLMEVYHCKAAMQVIPVVTLFELILSL